MFNRLMYLQPSGLIVDSGKLDLLFTLPMTSDVLGISTGSREDEIFPPLLLIEPSMRAYNESLPSIISKKYSDNNFLQNFPIKTRTSKNQTNLVMKTSSFHLEDGNFDLTSFMENTAYVHISDPDMPGPEYDAPRSKLLRARPKQAEQRKVWEAVYERYREQRMEICGLDLEPNILPGNIDSIKNHPERLQVDEQETILMLPTQDG